MKLGPVTKLEKRNKTSKKNDDDVTSANCDVIVIFPIYGQSKAIQNPDSGRIVCQTFSLITLHLLHYLHYLHLQKLETVLKNH